MKAGILYCVSTGPGDPELMTLKAVRVTEECPIIALSVDKTGRDKDYKEEGEEVMRRRCAAYQIAAPVVPGLDDKKFLYLSMPMVKDRQTMKESHKKAAARIIKQLETGQSVAWLTLGDATVYATSMYAAEIVKEQGFQIQVISGVPSFCAAAARLKEALVNGPKQLHVIPSSYQMEDALSYSGVKVFMKAGSHIGELKNLLQKSGYEGKGVERCGMKGERIYESLEELKEDAGYYTVLIVK